MRFAADKAKATIRVNIVRHHEYHDVVAGVCRKLGFRQAESVNIYTCHKDMYPVWETFMNEKGSRLSAYLKRRGYQVSSFAEAPESIISQLHNSPTQNTGTCWIRLCFWISPRTGCHGR